MPPTPTTILSLPFEIQSRILFFLPLLVQGRATHVCKLWQTLLNSHQLRKTRYQVICGSMHPRDGRPVLVHQFFSSKVRCDSNCIFCKKEGREKSTETEDEDEDEEGNSGDNETYKPQYDRTDGYEYQDGSFLSARVSRKTVEIKGYEFWIAIHPEPERSWSPAFDERFHKPRLSTSFPWLDDPVFLLTPKPTVEAADGTRAQERGSSGALEYGDPTNPEGVTDVVVPVRYRIRFPDTVSELEPAERELRISPATTVRQLVSKTWGVLREECFAYRFAEDIRKIEYIKFQFGTPSSRDQSAQATRPPGFFVELYAERDREKGCVFSRATLRRHKHFLRTQGKPRYQTRSVSRGQNQGKERMSI
ncbi:hypothetical protein TWF718_005116 [Orbilia javanica]|uniref:F-box domain-containing protein n=1 Tax=Orbilia javanica TaxID=47235 RepID=A0AAN8RLL8_9PEZI